MNNQPNFQRNDPRNWDRPNFGSSNGQYQNGGNTNPYGYTPPQPTTPSRLGTFGYFINSESDIVPGDIPMDGGTYIFPFHNGSSIIAKSWDNKGILQTMYFVPYKEPEKAPVETNDFASGFNGIMERLDKLIELNLPKKPKTKQTNEGDGNE